MAETLFGEEFSNIAAQVAAMAAAELSANDDLEFDCEKPTTAMPAPDFEGATAISVDPTPTPDAAASPEVSASQQRLATVRALNGTPNVMPPPPPSVESIVMAHETAPSVRASAPGDPESIENQINTSITQTLKALKVPPATCFDLEDDDDDGEKKSFFSRFRRS